MTLTQPAPKQSLAIAALISGLLSVLLVALFWIATTDAIVAWIGLAVGVLAVVLGILALVKHQSKGFALTGLIAGAISILVVLAILLFALIFIGAIAI